ncbi:hypothetical protein MSG28_007336 [Choristoneura fumiferana]|uniref:Uncharacterized protein n=1 Tax=Choristoneura fumiferana TaxID=7141 RepID=A0ACC0JWV2_CHOFU|nr:hypothetical protein MSG28_007336 [Choristoneura fumiferana]
MAAPAAARGGRARMHTNFNCRFASPVENHHYCLISLTRYKTRKNDRKKDMLNAIATSHKTKQDAFLYI